MEAFTQCGFGRSDHVTFGRAHVHQQGIGREGVSQRSKTAVHRADRNSQQDQIGILHGLRHVGAGLVDDLQFKRSLTCFFGGAETGDALHQAGLAQRKRKRAAHQAAANQGQALKLQHSRSRSLRYRV